MAGVLDSVLQDVFLRVRTAERDGLWQRAWDAERLFSEVSDMGAAMTEAFGGVFACCGVRAAQADAAVPARP